MKLPSTLAISLLVFLLSACSAAAADAPEETVSPAPITYGTETQRGFLNDHVCHSELGEIHYSSYIPESYDGSEPYALWAQTWWRTSARRPLAGMRK